MKFIGKLLLYILIALLVAIAGLYFLLQTRWGAEHISAWVSENSDYHLAFGAMDHRFSAPSHIVLENVTFGRDGQPATLVAKSVDIALSSRQLTDLQPTPGFQRTLRVIPFHGVRLLHQLRTALY